MAAFLFYIAGLGTVLSISLMLPVIVGLANGETETALHLFIYISLLGFVACCVLMGTQGRAGPLDRIHGLVLMVVAWILFPLLIAFPIADILNISYIDALFEAVSGFTTTGASGLATLENIPATIILLRAELQWLGGLATLVSFTLVLAPNGIGGLPRGTVYRLAVSVLSSPDRLVRYCLVVSEIYLLVTVVCYCALMLTGTTPFDGLVLTMTAVSTGGFLPSDAPLDEVVSTSGLLVMTFFMLIAATSVFWHRMIMTGQKESLLQHRESYYLLVLFVLISIYVSQALINASSITGLKQLHAFAEGIFSSASIISTSGIESRPGVFSILSPVIVLTLLVIGGGCFSTSGGAKLFRIGAMGEVALREINRLIYPHAVNRESLGSLQYEISMMKSLWSFFIIAIVTILAGGLALSLSDFDFQAAFTASVAAFSNAGPAYSPFWSHSGTQGWPAYFEMDALHKMMLAVLMILGRLEIVAVFAVFNIDYWMER